MTEQQPYPEPMMTKLNDDTPVTARLGDIKDLLAGLVREAVDASLAAHPRGRGELREQKTLQEAVEAFLATRVNLRQASQRHYASVLSRLIAYTGDVLVAEMSTERVQAFLSHGEVKAVTRHSYRRHVRAFFRWLVKQGWLAADPVVAVRLERAPAKHPRYLTPQDHAALLSAIRHPSKHAPKGSGLWLVPIVEANVYLGLRSGEVVNLRWEDVNLDAGTLTVRCTEEFETKTGQDRMLPVPEPALRVLRRLHEQGRRSEWVFPNAQGGQLGLRQLGFAFKLAARRAGLSEEICAHSMRHTAASWLAQGGASVEAIRIYMGHSTIMVTQRYMHLSPSDVAGQVRRAFG